jgi:hypothetical protein
MRRSVFCVLALSLLAPAAVAAGGPKPVLAQATGRIKALRASRITVGRLTCTIGAGAPSVHRFATGDPVANTCRGRALRSIRSLPRRAAVTTEATATTTTPATTTAPSGGAGRVTSPTITSSATGPITALDASGITVGDVTCAFNPGFYTQISQTWRVGDLAYIGCGNGVVIVGPPS